MAGVSVPQRYSYAYMGSFATFRGELESAPQQLRAFLEAEQPESASARDAGVGVEAGAVVVDRQFRLRRHGAQANLDVLSARVPNRVAKRLLRGAVDAQGNRRRQVVGVGRDVQVDR